MSEQTPEDGQVGPATPPPMPPPAAPPAPPSAYPTYPAQPPPPAHPAQPQYPTQPQYPAQPQYPTQPHYPAQQAYPQYNQPGYGYPPAYGYPQSASVQQRPGTLTTAYVITWVLLSLTMLGLLVVLAVALSNNNDFYDAIRDAGESTDDIRTAVTVGCVVLLVWCALALLFSIFGFRRHNWGRIALTVSAVISVPVQFVAIAAVVPLVSAIATIAVIVLLYVGDANAWYRSRNDGPAQAPPGVTFYQ